VSKAAGFSRHAGVVDKAVAHKKLEHLRRYIASPAVSQMRLSLTAHGNMCYQLETPNPDGTRHVLFEPLDFVAWLAGLMPKPRCPLPLDPTRLHGVFPPDSAHRARVTAVRCSPRPSRTAAFDPRPYDQPATAYLRIWPFSSIDAGSDVAPAQIRVEMLSTSQR
jgi:hypothetical protein